MRFWDFSSVCGSKKAELLDKRTVHTPCANVYQICSLKHSTMHPVLHLGDFWWIFHHRHFSASELAFSLGSILECSGSSVLVLRSVEIWEEGLDGMV